MRSSIVRWAFIGLFITCLFPVQAGSQTTNIIGTYALYQEGDKSGKIVGYISISRQTGNDFSVGIASRTGNPAVDWQGEGKITGNGGGYYTWRFDDGKQGITTFTIDNQGNLHGQVQGSGLDWRYVARRR